MYPSRATLAICLLAWCTAVSAQRRDETHLEKGVALFAEHDDTGEAMAEAEKEFRFALHVNPRDAVATAYLGFIADDRGEAIQAEALFRQALDFDSKCAEGRIGLSRLRAREGKRDEALSLLREAVSASPRHVMALHELAGLLTVDGGRPNLAPWKEAMGCWRTLVRMNRDDRYAHEKLADAYRRFGLWADAEREYREVVRIGQLPDDGDVWIYSVHRDIAEMLEKQGRPGDAIAEWRVLAQSEFAGDFEIESARANIERLQRGLSRTAPNN